MYKDWKHCALFAHLKAKNAFSFRGLWPTQSPCPGALPLDTAGGSVPRPSYMLALRRSPWTCKVVLRRPRPVPYWDGWPALQCWYWCQLSLAIHGGSRQSVGKKQWVVHVLAGRTAVLATNLVDVSQVLASLKVVVSHTRHAVLAIYLCLSVCLSLCLSQAGVLSK